jgi:pimeloyl-ACP methyl ester carboxylesterase
MIYLLLHGGAHGSWAWEPLVPRLQARGHTVICPVIPMDDPAAGVQDWAGAACRSIDSVSSSEIVVVGHSLAGLALPVIATMRPVQRMVFLCAVVPLPARPHRDCLGDPPTAITLRRDRLEFDAAGSMIVPWPTAREFYYQDCDEAVARAAWDRMRPSAQSIWKEVSPIDTWPFTQSAYILGKFDRSLSPDYSRRASRDLLGVDAIELDSGHVPMLSCPDELAAALDTVVSGPAARQRSLLSTERGSHGRNP